MESEPNLELVRTAHRSVRLKEVAQGEPPIDPPDYSKIALKTREKVQPHTKWGLVSVGEGRRFHIQSPPACQKQTATTLI